MSGQTSLDALAARRADVQAELDSLQAVEQGNLEMDTFIESLDQAKDALNGLAKDTDSVTGTIGEHKQTLEQAAKALEKAHGELSGYITQVAEAGGKVKDGVGQLSAKAKEAAGQLESLHDKLAYVQKLIAAGEGSAADVLAAFDDYLGDIVGKLEPLVGRIPGLGAFLQIWSKAIRSIAVSAHAIEGEVARRNAIGREAGLDFDVYVQALGSRGQRRRRIAELQKKLADLDEQIGSQTAVAEATDQRIRTAEWGMADNAIDTCLTKAGVTREDFRDQEGRLARARRDLMVAYDRYSTAEAGLGLDGAGGAVLHGAEAERARRQMDQAARDMERLLPEFERLRTSVQAIYDCAHATLVSLGTDGIKIRMRLDARSSYGGMRILGDPENLRLERTAWDFGYGPPSAYDIEQAVKRHAARTAPATRVGVEAAPKKNRKLAAVGLGAAALIGVGYVAFGGSPACAASATDPDCPPEVALTTDGASTGTSVAPPAPAPTATTPPAFTGSQISEHLDWLAATLGDDVALALVGGITRDAFQDIIFSISSARAGRTEAWIDLLAFGGAQVDLDQRRFTDLFGNTVFPCGLDDGQMRVVCPDGDRALPEGPLTLAFAVLGGDLRAADTGQVVYALVADRDGDAANDWRTQGQYDWDYFQGTDTWVQLTGDVATGAFRASVVQVTADQQQIATDTPVRIVIRGDTIMFVVPASLIPGDAGYRLTTFVHDGTFAAEASGGDVSGADPTEPLHR